MATHPASAIALSPEYALLGLLAQQPAHGYELHQRLTTELGQVWRVGLSQTYNILNRLEAQGFIAGAVHDQGKLPARRSFRLTPPGRRRFAAWLHANTRCSLRAIRVEFITRLYFARALYPNTVSELIDAQVAEVRAGLARLQAVQAELPSAQIINRLGLELRIRQLTSLLEWLAGCRTALGLHA